MPAGYLGPQSWELLMRVAASVAGRPRPKPVVGEPLKAEPHPAEPAAPPDPRQRAPA